MQETTCHQVLPFTNQSQLRGVMALSHRSINHGNYFILFQGFIWTVFDYTKCERIQLIPFDYYFIQPNNMYVVISESHTLIKAVHRISNDWTLRDISLVGTLAQCVPRPIFKIGELLNLTCNYIIHSIYKSSLFNC